jgi:hypothetical protein
VDIETLRTKYTTLAPVFSERSRRLWAATEARALGRGGIERVKEVTGLARSTIERGIRELESEETLSRSGPGGREEDASERPRRT